MSQDSSGQGDPSIPGSYDRGCLGVPGLAARRRRGSELDLYCGGPGTSCCPLREIKEEVREGHEERDRRERQQKEKMDKIMAKSRAQTAFMRWREQTSGDQHYSKEQRAKLSCWRDKVKSNHGIFGLLNEHSEFLFCKDAEETEDEERSLKKATNKHCSSISEEEEPGKESNARDDSGGKVRFDMAGAMTTLGLKGLRELDDVKTGPLALSGAFQNRLHKLEDARAKFIQNEKKQEWFRRLPPPERCGKNLNIKNKYRKYAKYTSSYARLELMKLHGAYQGLRLKFSKKWPALPPTVVFNGANGAEKVEKNQQVDKQSYKPIVHDEGFNTEASQKEQAINEQTLLAWKGEKMKNKELRLRAREQYKTKRDIVRVAQEAKKEQCVPIVSLKFESTEPRRRTVFDGTKNRELPPIEISSVVDKSVIIRKNIRGH